MRSSLPHWKRHVLAQSSVQSSQHFWLDAARHAWPFCSRDTHWSQTAPAVQPLRASTRLESTTALRSQVPFAAVGLGHSSSHWVSHESQLTQHALSADDAMKALPLLSGKQSATSGDRAKMQRRHAIADATA